MARPPLCSIPIRLPDLIAKIRGENSLKKNFTPAIGDNVIEGKKKQIHGNTNQVICYNCQKKGHFANEYTKPKK